MAKTKGRNKKAQPRRRRRRRAKSYVLHYLLLLCFCAAVTLTLCYAVFFKVEKIRIDGVSVYSEEQLIDLTGVSIGDSLFQINISNIQRKLLGKLPYIKNIKVKRRLPTTLHIIVEEEEPMGAVYTGEGYAIISATGKVVETKVLNAPKTVPRVLGLEEQPFEAGLYAKEASDKPKNANLLPQVILLQEFNREWEASGMPTYDYVDLSNIYDIKVMLDGRYLINFGTEHMLDRKLLLVKNTLDTNGGETPLPEEGEFDVSGGGYLSIKGTDINKIKDPKGYMDFAGGKDSSQINQEGIDSKQPGDAELVPGDSSEAYTPQTASTPELTITAPATNEPIAQQSTGEPAAVINQAPGQTAKTEPPPVNQAPGQTAKTEQPAVNQAPGQTAKTEPPPVNQAPGQEVKTEPSIANPAPDQKAEPVEDKAAKEGGSYAYNEPSGNLVVNEG